MWNTGTKIVANGFHYAIKLVDLEDQSRSIIVPPRTARMWDDTIIPWCANDNEAREKPFVVKNLETNDNILIIFQRYDNNTVHTYSYADNSDPILLHLPYNKSTRIYDSIGGPMYLAPQSRIDLFVQDARISRNPSAKVVKRVWGAPAGLTVADAQSILNEATAYWYT